MMKLQFTLRFYIDNEFKSLLNCANWHRLVTKLNFLKNIKVCKALIVV